MTRVDFQWGMRRLMVIIWQVRGNFRGEYNLLDRCNFNEFNVD